MCILSYVYFFLRDSHCIFVQPAIKLLDFFRNLSAGDLQVTTDGRLDAEAGGYLQPGHKI